MEKKLKTLFDLQKFSGSAQLQRVIDQVHARYGITDAEDGVRELELDELEWVAAAGAQTSDKRLEKKENEST